MDNKYIIQAVKEVSEIKPLATEVSDSKIDSFGNSYNSLNDRINSIENAVNKYNSVLFPADEHGIISVPHNPGINVIYNLYMEGKTVLDINKKMHSWGSDVGEFSLTVESAGNGDIIEKSITTIDDEKKLFTKLELRSTLDGSVFDYVKKIDHKYIFNKNIYQISMLDLLSNLADFSITNKDNVFEYSAKLPKASTTNNYILADFLHIVNKGDFFDGINDPTLSTLAIAKDADKIYIYSMRTLTQIKEAVTNSGINIHYVLKTEEQLNVSTPVIQLYPGISRIHTNSEYFGRFNVEISGDLHRLWKSTLDRLYDSEIKLSIVEGKINESRNNDKNHGDAIAKNTADLSNAIRDLLLKVDADKVYTRQEVQTMLGTITTNVGSQAVLIQAISDALSSTQSQLDDIIQAGLNPSFVLQIQELLDLRIGSDGQTVYPSAQSRVSNEIAQLYLTKFEKTGGVIEGNLEVEDYIITPELEIENAFNFMNSTGWGLIDVNAPHGFQIRNKKIGGGFVVDGVSLRPLTNMGYNLGTVDNRWGDIYAASLRLTGELNVENSRITNFEAENAIISKLTANGDVIIQRRIQASALQSTNKNILQISATSPWIYAGNSQNNFMIEALGGKAYINRESNEILTTESAYTKDEVDNKLSTQMMVIGNVSNNIMQLHDDTQTELGGSFKAKTIVINTYLHDHTQKPRIWVSNFKIHRLDNTILNISDIESATFYLYGAKNGREFTYKTDFPLINAFDAGSGFMNDKNNEYDTVMYTGIVVTLKQEEEIRYVKYHIESDPDASSVTMSSSMYRWNEYEENADVYYDQFAKFNSQRGKLYGLDYENPPTFTGYGGDFEYRIPHAKDYLLKEEMLDSRGEWSTVSDRLDFYEESLSTYGPLFGVIQEDLNEINSEITTIKGNAASLQSYFETIILPRIKNIEAALNITVDDGHPLPVKPRPKITWEHASYQSTSTTVWFYTDGIGWDDIDKYNWTGAGLTNSQNANNGLANTYYFYNWGSARGCVCMHKTDIKGWADNLSDIVKITLFNSWFINEVQWLG